MKGVYKGVITTHIMFAAASAAFFPPTPEGITIVESKINPGISISYKETKICETTPGVKSYSGYVHLPPNPTEGRDYNVNTFFWFFEARKDPANAPLSLWIQGGPGVPSIPAAVGENGPCSIAPNSKDTVLNPWSWNNEVNMLYIDQPVQVGFSYNSLVNGTINQLLSPVDFFVQDFSASGVPAVNDTFFVGTFASQNKTNTASTTTTAARAIWHFMQTWTEEFPIYKPNDDRISLWTESYGGHYGPTFADFFQDQNDLVRSGALPSTTKMLHLDTVGIINGCSDIITQMPLYPEMAFNNTYGLQIITQAEYESAVSSGPMCEKMSLDCRAAVAAGDPQGLGNNKTVNDACLNAYVFCFGKMWNPYNNYGRAAFDIAATLPNPFPPKFAAGYLNTKEVQLALGVPLNFTGQSRAVSDVFNSTGDFVRAGNLEAMGRLLDRNVKVALVYGDRDYQCNWLGGEKLSLAINSMLTPGFHKAGYANIETNGSYVGGAVRQYGNLSFSRVFSAGHEVPYYQPETAYRIFSRVMGNADVATGKLVSINSATSNYSSAGPSSVFQIKNAMPPPTEPLCYTWDVAETCTKPQRQMLQDGSAIIKDFVMIGYKDKNGTTVLYHSNTTTATTTTPPGSSGLPNSASGALSPSMGRVVGQQVLFPLALIVIGGFVM